MAKFKVSDNGCLAIFFMGIVVIVIAHLIIEAIVEIATK